MNEAIPPPKPQSSASPSKLGPLNSQKVIFVLPTIMALQMTSYVMILPLFARRFNEFNAGVEALGISAMAFALTSTLSAPFMGGLADRLGRRPLILGSLAAYIVAFIGFLLARSSAVLIVIRGAAGAFTAGLMPAAAGLATDLAPADHRAQWIGFVSGGAAFGWIVGPIAGGAIYDRWGYTTAIVVSIITAVITFFVALLAVPKNQHSHAQKSLDAKRDSIDGLDKKLKTSLSNFRRSLPNSLSAFLILLFICFTVLFAWAFMEPEFMFYAYNDLGWSSSQLGLAMSAYGVAMMVGEFAFGRSSDRLGRKPIILIGLILFSAQFIGLAFFKNYYLIAAAFLVAGLGNALYDPAISAYLLDISPVEHRARTLGVRYTAGSLGSILGPALVVLATSSINASGIFMISVGVVLLAVIAGVSLKASPQPSRHNPVTHTAGDNPPIHQPIDD